MTRKILCLASCAAILLIAGTRCDYPYEPKFQLQPQGGTTSNASLWSLNPNNQTCNPSITQNQTYFPACMLWLSLQGELSVKVKPEWATKYTLFAPTMHERLTIADTTDSVRWFLKKPNFVAGQQMQDPEWSTHPDYIAFLGENSTGWDGFIVRISDKKAFKFNDQKLVEVSSPHLWLPSSVPVGVPGDGGADPTEVASSHDATTGMADTASVMAYFGTDSVKIAFSKNLGSGLTVHYVDYSEGSPVVHVLNRPAGKSGWNCESPMFSPDGDWIVFNCRKGNDSCDAYLQKVDPASTPILITRGAAEPHWLKSPADGSLYISYCTILGPLEQKAEDYLVKGTAPFAYTKLQRVTPPASSGDIPSYLVFPGDPKTLANFPFQGGISRDGRYICTGYKYAYVYAL
jgi:hypothetical protein